MGDTNRGTNRVNEETGRLKKYLVGSGVSQEGWCFATGHTMPQQPESMPLAVPLAVRLATSSALCCWQCTRPQPRHYCPLRLGRVGGVRAAGVSSRAWSGRRRGRGAAPVGAGLPCCGRLLARLQARTGEQRRLGDGPLLRRSSGGCGRSGGRGAEGRAEAAHRAAGAMRG